MSGIGRILSGRICPIVNVVKSRQAQCAWYFSRPAQAQSTRCKSDASRNE